MVEVHHVDPNCGAVPDPCQWCVRAGVKFASRLRSSRLLSSRLLSSRLRSAGPGPHKIEHEAGESSDNFIEAAGHEPDTNVKAAGPEPDTNIKAKQVGRGSAQTSVSASKDLDGTAISTSAVAFSSTDAWASWKPSSLSWVPAADIAVAETIQSPPGLGRFFAWGGRPVATPASSIPRPEPVELNAIGVRPSVAGRLTEVTIDSGAGASVINPSRFPRRRWGNRRSRGQDDRMWGRRASSFPIGANSVFASRWKRAAAPRSSCRQPQ